MSTSRGPSAIRERRVTVRRRFTRMRACCAAPCDFDGPAVPILVVAALLSAGLMLTAWCLVHTSKHGLWHIPLINILCAFLPVIPMFCCGGAEDLERVMKGEEAWNEAELEKDNWYAAGWFMIGATFMSSFACPVLTGQFALQTKQLPEYIIWISSGAAWSFTGALILGLAFSVRKQTGSQEDY